MRRIKELGQDREACSVTLEQSCSQGHSPGHIVLLSPRLAGAILGAYDQRIVSSPLPTPCGDRKVQNFLSVLSLFTVE